MRATIISIGLISLIGLTGCLNQDTCIFDPASYISQKMPKDTSLVPSLIKHNHEPDEDDVYQWPHTKESDEVLRYWWEKAGRNLGYASSIELVLPAYYHSMHPEVTIYFSDGRSVGLEPGRFVRSGRTGSLGGIGSRYLLRGWNAKYDDVLMDYIIKNIEKPQNKMTPQETADAFKKLP